MFRQGQFTQYGAAQIKVVVVEGELDVVESEHEGNVVPVSRRLGGGFYHVCGRG
ncbi:hypothetical protein GCM10022414_21750 [Zhongshania borealis]|uniref:Uncharacterized protein n=1 Tax=Zhongshania borealis TaxID=889488 RepID=A0ABP7WU40_9GAMM